MTSVPAVHAKTMRAEYSLAKAAATGKWVAVGMVRAPQLLARRPAWVLVGMGETEVEAIDDLRRNLEREIQYGEALGV